ncbi:RAD55 family ATPase [Thermococcus waiotapuensis]|uniref:Uncharacterized protein n=1 Tax=Thermococcus waiotapuensis TaxID=90909 RepID=A0AAE4NUQ0_9EURY|nr:hypothetical protein [Thermococcus waiotapuensis]MDV3104713.1 hypothetical protein [Thermococcus waiotapuensis]
MEVLSTGIPLLDEALGGGLLEDSNLLITYDTYSNGWGLAVEILRNRIREGDFGVILDYVLPLTPLRMELGMLNFDVEKEGKAGNLAIVDIFSSFHKLDYGEDYVYTGSTWIPRLFSPSTSTSTAGSWRKESMTGGP